MNSLPYCSGSVSQSSRSSLLSGRYFEMRLLQMAVTVGGSKKSRLILSASNVGESFRLSSDLGSLYSAQVRTWEPKKNHVIAIKKNFITLFILKVKAIRVHILVQLFINSYFLLCNPEWHSTIVDIQVVFQPASKCWDCRWHIVEIASILFLPKNKSNNRAGGPASWLARRRRGESLVGRRPTSSAGRCTFRGCREVSEISWTLKCWNWLH